MTLFDTHAQDQAFINAVERLAEGHMQLVEATTKAADALEKLTTLIELEMEEDS